MIARCPKCKSIWVCWNWIIAFGGDVKKMLEANPHCKEEDIEPYGHECWDCGDEMGGHCHTTKYKVKNGVPYWLLKLYGKWKWRNL